METHPYGWLSLAPPLVAIVLAIVTRRAALSLLAGIFCGALLTTGGRPWAALYDTFEVHLWATFVDPDKLRVFCFTLLMGAMIEVINRSGGMQELIGLIAPLAKTRRGGQLTTWLLGLVVFFDDYANTMLLGNTLRPLCDRLKISRQKLAYLVDSTAAPVAGLALLSTWVAIEIDYVREGLEILGDGHSISAIDLFVSSIAYRFYVLLALLMVPLVAISGRDFGPMLTAERQAQQATGVKEQLLGVDPIAGLAVPKGRWYHAVVPIVLTLVVMIGLLYVTGKARWTGAAAAEPTLRDIVGAADSSLALQYGSLAGLAIAVLLVRAEGTLDQQEIADAVVQGVRVVVPALLILWSAGAMSRMTSSKSVSGTTAEVPYEFQDHRLYTGEFLVQTIMGGGDAAADASDTLGYTAKLLPTAVFLLAAVLSFSTGTSFGTMGILMPMTITMAHSVLLAGQGSVATNDPIFLACVGSVLAGAIFGDHCSPISDTTILSSQSCGCDHIAHVMTQLPYALLVAIIAIVCGTLPVGWGLSVWILLPTQFAGLVAVLLLFGRKVECR